MILNGNYTKTIKAKEFIGSESGKRFYDELLKMIDDTQYNTDATFSPNAKDGKLLFIDKHMGYVCTHLKLDPTQYLSNLQLITKKRP